tara:strand:- start:2750 stop:2926 length:177 start_codon:yes stop_codon:yes gene_type:complete
MKRSTIITLAAAIKAAAHPSARLRASSQKLGAMMRAPAVLGASLKNVVASANKGPVAC